MNNLPILKRIFAVNDRVIVSASGGWSHDVPGAVISLPEEINTKQGEDYFYWVRFDKPQEDLSHDGPYTMSQILSRYISHCEPPEEVPSQEKKS